MTYFSSLHANFEKKTCFKDKLCMFKIQMIHGQKAKCQMIFKNKRIIAYDGCFLIPSSCEY